MQKRGMLVGFLMLAAVVLLVGCGGAAPTTEGAEEPVPIVARSADEVIAEASIQPARWSELSFETGGEVVEVLVEEGDRVAEGSPLLLLDTDELALSLESAREDVAAQRAALAQLAKGASERVIARADKDNADQIAQAEVAVQAAKLQLEKARAEDPTSAVEAAQAGIKQLERQLAQTRAQNLAPDVEIARVELERAQIALADAQNEYNKALDRPWEDQEIRDAWAKQLEQAQLNYRSAQAQLDRSLSLQRAHTLSLEVLAAQMEDAQTQLSQAVTTQEAYTVSLELLASEVEAAQIRLEALRTWDNPYRDEASDEEIAQAEARLRQTELAVSRLELQLRDAELSAPFESTVVDVRVEVGDQLTPGQVVVVLADLAQLEAVTTDLTELDVAQVDVGQPAVVTVDALPDVELDGVVSDISLRAGDYRGDVVYTVTVELNNAADVPLRWGMTTVVKIKTR